MRERLEQIAAAADMAANHAELVEDAEIDGGRVEGAATAIRYLCEGMARDARTLARKVPPATLDLEDLLARLEQALIDADAGEDGPQLLAIAVDRTVQDIREALEMAP